MKKIGFVINYCTNEYRFLRACIEGIRPLASSIIICVCDHFFDGRPEDRGLLHRSYQEHPEAHFIEFSYNKGGYGLYGGGREGKEAQARHLHNAGRYIGALYMPDEIEYIVFVDADEIADGARFKEWAEASSWADAMIFSSYVYLGDESRRSLKEEHAYLMVKREALELEMLFNSHERPGFFHQFEGNKVSCLKGLDEKPMIHHYNWVRSQEELIRKVSCWGHLEEKDWIRLIREGQLEKVTGHQYEKVAPSHQLLCIDVEAIKRERPFGDLSVSHFPNLLQVSPQTVMRKMITRDFC